jgi:hypothetical protein
MGQNLINSLVTVAVAIIGVAIVAVLVSKNAQTTQVLGAASSGFSGALSTALSPVTGGSGLGSTLSGFPGGPGGTIAYA